MNAKPPLLLALVALLAGCSSEPETPAVDQSAQLTLHEFMIEKIDKDADVIWGIGNKAIAENATLDPALLSEEDWKTLAEAGTRMARDARELAAINPITVTRDGVPIADEGTPGAPTTQQIEGHIAKDHDLFSSLADSLGNHADELSKAASARDVATASRLVNELDGVCEACHLEFWYPEQKAMMKQMGIDPFPGSESTSKK